MRVPDKIKEIGSLRRITTVFAAVLLRTIILQRQRKTRSLNIQDHNFILLENKVSHKTLILPWTWRQVGFFTAGEWEQDLKCDKGPWENNQFLLLKLALWNPARLRWLSCVTTPVTRDCFEGFLTRRPTTSPLSCLLTYGHCEIRPTNCSSLRLLTRLMWFV